MSKMQRRKGQTYERKFARWLRDSFGELGLTAKRGWQSRNGGKEEADVEVFVDGDPLPIHFELSHGKAPPIWRKYAQAQDDAKPGEMPIAVVKRNREDSRVMLSLDDFAEFFDAWLRMNQGATDRRQTCDKKV